MFRIGLFLRIVIVLAAVFAVVGSLPSFLGKDLLFLKPLTLGLDLQGGSHLLLEVDEEGLITDLQDKNQEEARRALQDAGIDFSDVRPVDSNTLEIIVEPSNASNAISTLNNYFADFDIQNNEGIISLALTDLALQNARAKAVEQSLEIIRRRVDETGAKEPVIQIAGKGRILVQLPGEQNPDRLKTLLGKTAKLTFHLVDEEYNPISGRPVPIGTIVVSSSDKDSEGSPLFSIPVKRRSLLGGEHLEDASPTIDQSGLPIVQFRFDTYGARAFGRITGENVGKRLAILLDNEVISAPVIQSPILGGSGIIEGGSMDITEARDLSVLMRAGALPVPLNIVEERSVGAGLGADSISAAIKAAILAMALLAGYMIYIYRSFGVFAMISLSFNGLLIVAILGFFGATLTLPGLAGVVLTAGMAVDANVLIFERIREEANLGKKLVHSLESGFEKAFATIFDSNLTTLFAGIVLFSLGSGPIRGFAITLSVGILSSVFTALLPTRWMISLWYNRVSRRKVALPLPY